MGRVFYYYCVDDIVEGLGASSDTTRISLVDDSKISRWAMDM